MTGFNLENKLEAKLMQTMLSGHFPHAVILEGGSPEERMALAKKTAGALVCSENIGNMCGKCSNCIKAKADSHADILIYSVEDKPKAFKIDIVREIRNKAYIVPNEAQRKVFILENAHTMGMEGQNAILKILEEPPKYVSFILLCPSKSGFLETVLSRAAVYSLGQAKTPEDDKEKRENIVNAATAVVEAIYSQNEFEIVKAAAIFEKDAGLFRAALPIIQEILALALKEKFDVHEDAPEFSQTAVLAASHMNKRVLLETIEVIDTLISATKLNANHNLMVTRLCTLLRRSAVN